MKEIWLVLIALWLAACGGAAQTKTEAPTVIPKPPTSTRILLPLTSTFTPAPTKTPRPTSTPRLAPTSTPTFAPVILTGSGDMVADVDKGQEARLAHIIYSGSGNFAVWNYGADGKKIELLVNTIGKYEGTRPLDFRDDEQTARFEITARGDWSIEILPLAAIRQETIPGRFDGKGDDVVFLVGKTPDLLSADANKAKGNFVIWAYGDRRELLVNEIAPYTGTVIVPSGMIVFAIEAEGEWTLAVTGK